MIAKQAIDEFLNAPVDDWSWVKQISKDALAVAVKDIYPGFDPKHLDPFKHQFASLLIGLSQKEFLFFLDMSLGKTVISLWMLSRLKSIGKLKSALVVVPNASVGNSWGNQIKALSNLKVVELFGTMLERTELLKDEADLFIINYTGLQILLTDVKMTGKGKSAKNKWVPSAKKVKELGDKFNVVIFDEIHYCKDKGSLNFRLCNRLTDVCEYRYGLTGTPFGRNPQDLWSQFFLIDKGATLGTSLGLFREAFFTAEENKYWPGVTYTFKKELEPVLQKKLQNKSIRYAESETDMDLPPVIRNPIQVIISLEALEYYKAAMHKFITISGKDEQLENSFIKFRQITAGFLKYKTDEGEDVLIRFSENPKLDALENLILSAPLTAKFVIFNEFIESGNMIEELLKKLKIKHIRLYSGSSEKIKRNAESLFNEPDCRCILANSLSGGLGLNLQKARYTFFYERPTSPITNSQAEKRVARPGQTQTTFIYDLIMHKTVDEDVIQFHQEGKDLKDALLDYKRKVAECLI